MEVVKLALDERLAPGIFESQATLANELATECQMSVKTIEPVVSQIWKKYIKT